jgi:hypothetical protein
VVVLFQELALELVTRTVLFSTTPTTVSEIMDQMVTWWARYRGIALEREDPFIPRTGHMYLLNYAKSISRTQPSFAEALQLVPYLSISWRKIFVSCCQMGVSYVFDHHIPTT